MREVYEVLIHIAEDMMEPVGYLPLGIGAGIIYLAVYEVWRRIGRKYDGQSTGAAAGDSGRYPERRWLLALCIIYATVILYLAFFSREPGSRTGIDLMLFETWKDSPWSKAYVIENVLMFIPFGILFPAAFPGLRRGGFCTAAGLTFSVCLELAQLLTQRGHCQLDDVVMNTLGTWIGWMAYRMICRILKNKLT